MNKILILLLTSFWLSACSYAPLRVDPDPVSSETPHREAWLCYAHRYGELDLDRDYNLAREWCKVAADLGHDSSRTLLAELHFLGLGGPKNYREAFMSYLTSAENGHAHAQLMMFDLLRNGYGVAVNRQEALVWLRRAVRNGDKQAREVYLAIEHGRPF